MFSVCVLVSPICVKLTPSGLALLLPFVLVPSRWEWVRVHVNPPSAAAHPADKQQHHQERRQQARHSETGRVVTLLSKHLTCRLYQECLSAATRGRG